MELYEEEQSVAIEMTGEEDCSNPTTEISMHALTGTYNPRTLRLQGFVKGK